MSQEDMIIYGTLIALAIIVALLTWVGLKMSREAEAESRALTVEKLRSVVGSRILAGPFLWGIWQGVNTINEKRMEVKDEHGALVTVIWHPPLPTNGVIEHFELDGKRYERINEGLISGRVWLREASSGEIVLSAEHRTLDVSVYRGKTDIELARIHPQGLISELGALTRGDEKLGQHFYARKCHASVVALQRASLTRLEHCFVMLSIPRSN